MNRSLYILLFLFVGMIAGHSGHGQSVFYRTFDKQGSFEEVGIRLLELDTNHFRVAGMYFAALNPSYDPDIFLVDFLPDTAPFEWKTYGGPELDGIWDFKMRSDGTFFISGDSYNNSAGSADIYIIHADRQGDVIWESTFGYPLADWGLAIAPTPDGGAVVGCMIGESLPSSIRLNWMVLRLDQNGDSLWSRRWSHPRVNIIKDIHLDEQGNIHVWGTWNDSQDTTRHIQMYRQLDPDGTTVFEFSHDDFSRNGGFERGFLDGKGFMYTGRQGGEPAVQKFSLNGDLIWEVSSEPVSAVRKGPNGDPWAMGLIDSSGVDGFFITHYSTEGELISQHSYFAENDITARDFIFTLDGGIAVVGTQFNEGDLSNLESLVLIKLNCQGLPMAEAAECMPPAPLSDPSEVNYILENGLLCGWTLGVEEGTHFEIHVYELDGREIAQYAGTSVMGEGINTSIWPSAWYAYRLGTESGLSKAGKILILPKR